MPYAYLFDVQADYRQRCPGGYWFSAATMRFFRTRVGTTFCIPAREAYVFTTSEKPPHGPRAHSVRFMDRTGHISTVGPFCSLTRSVALRVARQLATTGRAILDGDVLTLPEDCGGRV